MNFPSSILFFALITFSSCGIKLFETPPHKIIIEKLEHGTINKKMEISSRNDIDKIFRSINYAYEEPIKFFPEYKLTFYYATTTENLLVKGRNLKLRGKTYIAGEDTSGLIEEITGWQSKK